MRVRARMPGRGIGRRWDAPVPGLGQARLLCPAFLLQHTASRFFTCAGTHPLKQAPTELLELVTRLVEAEEDPVEDPVDPAGTVADAAETSKITPTRDPNCTIFFVDTKIGFPQLLQI